MFAALAVLYAVTTLVASVVAVIFFEIGLGRLPIEGCARRRRWGTVCTEVSDDRGHDSYEYSSLLLPLSLSPNSSRSYVPWLGLS